MSAGPCLFDDRSVTRLQIGSGPVIRVLHVVPWLLSGGVERRRLELARRLPPGEFEQRMLCIEAHDEYRAAFEAAGVQVDVIGGRWTVTDALSVYRATRLIHEFGPHIVHGAVFEGVLMAAASGALGRAKRIVLEEIDYPITRSWRAQQLMRFVALTADLFVAVSPAVEDYLRNHLKVPSRKVRLIENGISVNLERVHDARDIRAALDLPPDAFVVGSVGRMVDIHKRFSDLIRVLAQLSSGEPPSYLVLVGDGPDRASLERLGRDLGLKDRLRFLGRRSDLEAIMPAFDVFALVSSRESFGLAIVEAMAFGLPVVATCVGGPARIVQEGETGFLVEPGDCEAIQTAFLQMRADPQMRRRQGEAGRVRANALFSARRYAEEVASMYKELVGRP